MDSCGKLAYRKHANQSETKEVNVIPDFSFAGDRGSVRSTSVPGGPPEILEARIPGTWYTNQSRGILTRKVDCLC